MDDAARYGGLGVIGWTAAFSLLCMIASAGFTYFIFRGEAPEVLEKAVVSSLMLPVFVGAPVYYLVVSRIRQLSAAAATDALTACLNKAAFTKAVSQLLADEKRPRRGGLLIIDADHFKGINDRFGHERGDEALRVIAETVRGVVRGADFVGRIGGEEFAVFLRDADVDAAERVAERIRGAIAEAEFIADGAPQNLTVSVGGAAFEHEVAFVELYKSADRQLYAAKAGGRNRVEVAAAPPPEAGPALAPARATA